MTWQENSKPQILGAGALCEEVLTAASLVGPDKVSGCSIPAPLFRKPGFVGKAGATHAKPLILNPLVSAANGWPCGAALRPAG